MPSPSGRPKTTTARPRPFVADCGSLYDRIMNGGGQGALELIAKRERSLCKCYARHLKAFCP